MSLSRRQALAALGTALVAGPHTLARIEAAERALPIGFAFSLYGMRSLPLPRALRVCADIGYSGVELACMTGWPCDPVALSPTDRTAIREQLTHLSLQLPALMENLRLVVPAAEHQANLERLKQVGQLAHDLTPEGEQTPLIETVLGGKPDDWDKVKDAMVQSLGDWERVAARARVQLAIKAHVSGALHRPEDVVWLVEQIHSPWVKAVYDFSHFERQGMTLRESLRQVLPETVFIHIKDNVKTPDGKDEFALPGDGVTNYRDYLKLLVDGRYEGMVCVEVSGQVFSKPGYNPIIAAERCYLNLRSAFEQAGARARA